MNSEELNLTILRKAEDLESQRHLADELGLSVGKVNYIIRELVKKGFLKIERFTQEKNKKKYCYLLTAKGIQEKYGLQNCLLLEKNWSMRN